MAQGKETPELIASVVQQVAGIVSELAGIQLGAKQAPMIENRLKTRMVRLGIKDFTEYLAHLKANREAESQALLSLMTTHHTYFFREFSHFEFLLNRGLSRLIDAARARPDKTIHIWSAACSRGQEVYSLAMFFQFHLPQMAPDLSYKIWGTDIDPESVAYGKNGVYKVEELKQSPAMYVENQWIRGKGNVSEFMKAKDTIKKNCHFTAANLMNPGSFLKDKKFDLIFCRNVYIYFNQDQIKQATTDMLKHLEPTGFLFLGVSESLNGLGLPTELIGPSIYQPVTKSDNRIERKPLSPAPATTKIVEVLSVDDSPTILTLLKKVLTPENGFQITATAKNGAEALELLKTRKFDIITLDLHMPELDGIGFLKAYQGQSTPVMVVSSINRDDTTIAQKALALGAADYVEKPSLENLAQAGNEIRSKIKTVLQLRKLAPAAKPAPSPVPGPKPAGSAQKIKVLIVDDSKTIRSLIAQILSKDPAFEVIGQAEKPSQVEALIKKNKPDVITLDIHMPEMDGVTLLQKIYPVYKIPTVMISSISKEEGPQVLRALEIGAIDYIQKPSMSDLSEAAQTIRERLKIAAQSKSIKRSAIKKTAMIRSRSVDHRNLIVMGASTGGTEALRTVLEHLPAQIPPILIVQHIPPVFSAAFAKRLNDLCPFEVLEAQNGDEVKPNRVLIAPGGKQMALKILKDKMIVEVNDDAPVNRHKPSVDYMFKTVADARLSKVVAVILTGMGADGAREMKTLRDQGARTIAQDQETSVVYGMPREAAANGGAEFVLPLDAVAEKMMSLCEDASTKPNKKAS